MKNFLIGKNPPKDLNVIIEIPSNSAPVKYEFNKETGLMEVDRISSNAMFYPCNYGFVPNTLCDDGDALDVLVICRYPLTSKSVINVKPIGVLKMRDESGEDEKILAIPSDDVCSYFSHVKKPEDLPSPLLQELKFFFTRYKDIYDNKWSEVAEEFDGPEEAEKMIIAAIDNYKK